jgi:Flp pilus assembly protein TadD
MNGMEDKPAGDAIERVRTLLNLGRAAEAMEACRRLLAADPDNPELLIVASIAAMRVKRNHEAVTYGRRAVALAPHADSAHGALASALLADGWEQDATSAAYTAVRLGPQNWVNHLRLAQCLLAVPGEREGAWQAASRAVELAPHEPETHLMIAEVAFTGGPSTPAEIDLAERAILEALRLDPTNAAAQNDLARVQLARSGVGGASAVLAGFSGAAVADPRRVGDVASDNVRLVLQQVIHWQGYLTLGGVCLGLGFVGKSPTLLGRIGLLVLLAALVGFLVLKWRHYLVGASQRVVIRHVLHHNRRLTGAAALLIVGIVVAAAAAFVPSGGVPNVLVVALVIVGSSLVLCRSA